MSGLAKRYGWDKELCPSSVTFQSGTIDCMDCGRRMIYLKNEPYCESEIINKQEELIDRLDDGFISLINEIADFFPQTPIKEFLELRRKNFADFVHLAIKDVNGTISDIEKVTLMNNSYFKKL